MANKQFWALKRKVVMLQKRQTCQYERPIYRQYITILPITIQAMFFSCDTSHSRQCDDCNDFSRSTGSHFKSISEVKHFLCQELFQTERRNINKALSMLIHPIYLNLILSLKVRRRNFQKLHSINLSGRKTQNKIAARLHRIPARWNHIVKHLQYLDFMSCSPYL